MTHSFPPRPSYDLAVVERFAARRARRYRFDEGFVAVVVAKVAQRVAIVLPIGLEDHAIRRSGAFHEAAGVEIAVGREQLAQPGLGGRFIDQPRSEEHTSELQSLMRNSYAVFCL